MEIWRDIPGYKNLYQASSLGRIKSLRRKRSTNGWLKERILQLQLSKGYNKIQLHKNTKVRTFWVAQLIAIVFLGHKPSGHKIVVDHIDGNKLNNNILNLQLITQRDNASKDRWKTNYTSKYVGVSWSKNSNKWISQTHINGKTIYIGSYDSEEIAKGAYDYYLSNTLISHHPVTLA